jgi:hypothetical protein
MALGACGAPSVTIAESMAAGAAESGRRITRPQGTSSCSQAVRQRRGTGILRQGRLLKSEKLHSAHDMRPPAVKILDNISSSSSSSGVLLTGQGHMNLPRQRRSPTPKPTPPVYSAIGWQQ